MSRRTVRTIAAGALVATSLALVTLVTPGAPAQAAGPADDPFYTYSGSTPLKSLRPGTVLKTRVVSYQLQGIPLPLPVTQILFRTEDMRGRAVVGATSVVEPPTPAATTQVVSYQSYYDSLDPADEPSAVIAGATGTGAGLANAETATIAQLLLAGYTVNIPDTEGQTADFAAGREYGVVTIDSLRAMSNEPTTGVGQTSPIGLLGYSGGAIASDWAAELVAKRAPRIAHRIVGTAMGGVLVRPSTNLHYVEGSTVWAGVIPMALIGASRGLGIDLTRYANAYGKQLFAQLQDASISEVLGQYPGLTWAQIAKSAYPTPESVPAYVRAVNKLIMGTGGTPSAPMFIGQGTRGELEGTPTGGDGIGEGDGVMVAGDVRSLAREYCDRGVTVQYQEYPLSHVTTMPAWQAQATTWLQDRFAGTTAPSSCGSIAPGNSLAPVTVQR